ncbi:anthranilate synthase component II [Enterococcus wangshanyuanii]|uniref:Anthranilate synthase component II n=1 Tax=Enterococcus wangshanyuanii TaxID=2005703 RepID=A0ABQ1P737_9ENTE|nr:aminodeoxychorismate/anthranilate synthase component II [Enterococcus wangshanyuanii]GGC91906.1 anthranilate synthase component II [Enterococcus wangshanyuanii]
MILLIDNYDSFTYNLAHLLGSSRKVVVARNDDDQLLELARQAKAIVISPGPGTPAETGDVKKVIHAFYQQKPILGICLGHQTIGEVFGAQVVLAEEIRHGKQSMITTESESHLFKDVASEVPVMRYHSLVIDPSTLSKEFIISATAKDDQEIMAIEHQKYPLFGLQFHPESIGTPIGEKIIQNFIQSMEDYDYETTT